MECVPDHSLMAAPESQERQHLLMQYYWLCPFQIDHLHYKYADSTKSTL